MSLEKRRFQVEKMPPGVKQKPAAPSRADAQQVFVMRHTFPFLPSLALALAAVAAASAADQAPSIGVVDVEAAATLSVRLVGSTPELQSLAQTAFAAHGRFRPVADRGAYTFKFTAAGANQVSVEVAKGAAHSVLASETVTGTSLRHALLRAADVAVTKTTGLRGIFAGKLAFVSDRTGRAEIYTSDLFFGEVLMHRAASSKQILGPHWAHDGARIIFTAYRPLFPDIYVLDVRNNLTSVLVSFKGTNSGGRFSPDGTRVAMVLSGEGNPEIYVGTAQGRQIRRLTRNDVVDASPCWSPDGTQLVFAEEPGPRLLVMPAGGGSASRLPTNISNYCAEPDWCRWDATKLAFTAGVGKGYQVAVYDFAARSAKIVSKAPVDAVEPCWLPDGRHLLYTARTASGKRLHLLDTETGRATALAPSGFGNAASATYLAP
jgi:TolB protein